MDLEEALNLKFREMVFGKKKKKRRTPDFNRLLTDAENIDGAGDANLEQNIAEMSLGDPLSYNMGHRARGLFLLFNVIGSGRLERKGTNFDADRMVETFKCMGFYAHRENDPTRENMIRILKIVAGFDHTRVDCVAVGILSHGNWETYQRDSDQEPTIADRLMSSNGLVFLKDLTEPLREKNCHKSLRGKPKLFFIQSCRGPKIGESAQYHDRKDLVFLSPKSDQADMDDADDIVSSQPPAMSDNEPIVQGGENQPEQAQPAAGKEVKVQTTETGEEATAQLVEVPEDVYDAIGPEDRYYGSLPEDMPIYKDFLIAWATAPGYRSSRCRPSGTVFVQTLCDYLKQYYAKKDLLTILMWCNSDIAHQFQSNTPSKPHLDKKKQMPWFFSRLTKELVFTPKPAVGGGSGGQ